MGGMSIRYVGRWEGCEIFKRTLSPFVIQATHSGVEVDKIRAARIFQKGLEGIICHQLIWCSLQFGPQGLFVTVDGTKMKITVNPDKIRVK